MTIIADEQRAMGKIAIFLKFVLRILNMFFKLATQRYEFGKDQVWCFKEYL